MAKAAGVSHGTASNVFSRPEIVRPEMRERVLAAAQKLGYGGPDPKGRLLRAGKVNAIGVATGEPLAYFFDDPFAGSSCRASRMPATQPVPASRWCRRSIHEQLAWNIQSALVDGFIVFCMEGGSRLVELARERKLPFVALDFGFDDDTIASIGVDDVAGARLAARHLADLGHRRFAGAGAAASRVGAPAGHRPSDGAGLGLFRHARPICRSIPRRLPNSVSMTATVPIYETVNDEAKASAPAWSISSAPRNHRPQSLRCPTRQR